MIINHNMKAINSNRVLKFKQWDVSRSMRALSSGKRITRAGDDASGLAVSEKLRSQIRGLRQAERNTENGISFIQTTEGYLQESQDILQRVRELAVQAANGVYSENDRMLIQVEVSQLIDELDRVASHAQFNKMNMLTGRFANASGGGTPTASLWLHVGANMDERKQVYIGTMTAAGLGLKSAIADSGISISNPQKANTVIGVVDEALLKVGKQRADLGAYQNRLELTAKGLMVGFENMQAAESLIRDADMAEFSVELAKDQVLQQVATTMLAQANQDSQTVLTLIR